MNRISCEEGVSSPVRQHQWSLSNWLAPRSESTWPIRMASQHDRMYMHVRLQHPIRVGTCSTARLLGWQS